MELFAESKSEEWKTMSEVSEELRNSEIRKLGEERLEKSLEEDDRVIRGMALGEMRMLCVVQIEHYAFSLLKINLRPTISRSDQLSGRLALRDLLGPASRLLERPFLPGQRSRLQPFIALPK